MSYKYSWTVTSNYHYDATLTQSLVNNWIADQKDSSGRDTHMYYITGVWDETWRWPSSSEKKQNTTSHYETETDEPLDPVPVNSTYESYENFTAITGVDFTTVTQAGFKPPLDIYIGDSTTATNVTFAPNALVTAGEKAVLDNITFVSGGSVLLGHSYHDEEEYVVSHTDMGDVVGTRTVYYPTVKASLTNLSAAEDFDTLVTMNGGSAYVNGVTVERKMRNLFVAGGSDGYYNVPDTRRFTGSGTIVSNVTVHGALSSAYVASGAVLDMLTVGNYRQWGADSHASAFLGVDVWGSTSHMSAVRMTVASGGSANNIFLGFGGSVTVEGPEDKVTSQWVSSGGSSYWEVTTRYAAGNGGVLTNLQMATHGGLMFEGGGSDLAQKTWSKPYNYDWESSKTYKSGFIASAPQSSYISFGSNTSGRNLTIGNGGSLYIGKNASVTGISMGGLLSSLTVMSSGATHVWIGDRGAKLVINGGYASDVKLDFVRQSFDYYSATHDYFWLLSDSLEKEYYSAHGSYGSGEAWSSSIYNSASSGYRQYMSGMYNSSGGVYTNLGDDTNPYARRYVGGEVLVAGGQILNVSGFCYLQAGATVDVTVSNNVSSFSARQWTNGHVSKAVGALSATMEVTDGGHVSNVKIEGGRVIMTGGGYVNARWHDQENKQSNYNLVEDLDLRFDDMGLGGDHPAYIEFAGGDSGGFGRYVYSGGTSSYIEQRYDAIDPGEIHSVTANSGLTVWANWNWGKQDFTYIGGGSVTINGLGTVVLKDNHSRYTSDSYYGKGPYLGSAFDTYYFGVVKGVYNEEDGTLENRTILDGTNGGFDWKGYLTVGSGGIVQNIGSASPLKTGNNIVNSDTWTPEYTRDECKVLTVVAGGSADHVTVKGAVSNFEHYESQYTENRAGLLVSSNGIATNVTILEGGIAMAKGGTIDKVFVGAGGILYLSGWAGAHQVALDDYGSQLAGPQYLDTTVLNAVRLDSGGQLTNTLDWGFRAGHAPSVIANKGGGILNGVTANGVAYVSGLDYAGTITLTNGQQAVDVTVRGYNKITSTDSNGNPTGYSTTIASLNVSSGAIVNGATVGDEGAIYVSTGANVSGLTASGGRIIFANSSGWSDYLVGSATVNGIAVLAGGVLEVNSKFGLTATNMQIGEGAGLTFTLGKTASEDYTPTELNGTWTASWGNGTFHTNDGVLSGFGGQFGQEYRDLFYSSAYVSARLSMTVADGGALTGADLRGYGSVRVTSGGKILNTKLKGITVNVGASGYGSGLSAMTESTGSAYDTNIYVYGSGALVENTTLSGGFLGVERFGVADSVTMLAPEGYDGPFGNQTEVGPAELEIYAGGTAKNVVASAGLITMLEGSKEPGTPSPTLSNADVHSAATLLVNCDGAVLDGTLNLGGLVTTTAKRYEWIEVQVLDPSTGSSYTDWERVERSNAVADAATLTVNFDLTERDGVDEDVMIDNLANLRGATLGSITVSADQAEGKYVLAQGAESFSGTLTVKRGDEELGTIGVGKYLQAGANAIYSLTNDAAEGLCFTVFSEVGAAVDRIVATVDGRELKNGEWVNKSVTVKGYGNQYSKSLWYRIRRAIPAAPGDADDGWTEIKSGKEIVVSERCYVDFKVKNDNGTDSGITTYTVNYDDVPAEVTGVRFAAADPAKPYLDAGESCTVTARVVDDLDPAPTLEINDGAVWNALVPDAGGYFSFSVTGNGEYQLRTTDHAGNVGESVVTVDCYGCPAVTATAAGVAVEGRPGAKCEVALSDGSGEATLPITGNAVSFYNLPDGCSVVVGYADEEARREVALTSDEEYAPSLLQAASDGVADVFFAQANGVWDSAYKAQHVGSVNDWTGTQETVSLGGKNKLCDLFSGSDDVSVLLLTDSANGDALFVDDIYTALPESVAEPQSRIAKLDEIRAGAGNDVVDMTSQLFEYTGTGLTVRGGLGNDTIWAAKGDNMLFGDAGNDRLVGASGNDVIAGGIGSDRMHGGGGEDLFTFCDEWGADTVEQLAEGSVTLWFASGDASGWNADTLTYRSGNDSVTVKGVSADQVTLKFGDDGSERFSDLAAAGAFSAFTSEKIFEDRNKGLLA